MQIHYTSISFEQKYTDKNDKLQLPHTWFMVFMNPILKKACAVLVL